MRCPHCNESVIVYDEVYEYARCLTCARSTNVLVRRGDDEALAVRLYSMELGRLKVQAVEIESQERKVYKGTCRACLKEFWSTAYGKKLCPTCSTQRDQERQNKGYEQKTVWVLDKAAIKLKMKDLDISQKMLAWRLGITPGILNHWISGGQGLQELQIKQLAVALEMPVDDFSVCETREYKCRGRMLRKTKSEVA